MRTQDDTLLPILYKVLDEISYRFNADHLAFLFLRLNQIPLEDYTTDTIDLISKLAKFSDKVQYTLSIYIRKTRVLLNVSHVPCKIWLRRARMCRNQGFFLLRYQNLFVTKRENSCACCAHATVQCFVLRASS